MSKIFPDIYAGKNVLRASETLVFRLADAPLTFFLPVVNPPDNKTNLAIRIWFNTDQVNPKFRGSYNQSGLDFDVTLFNFTALNKPWGTYEPLAVQIGHHTYLLHLSAIPLNTETAQVGFSLYERSIP